MADETTDDPWEKTRRHRAWAVAMASCCVAVAACLSLRDWLSFNVQTTRWRDATPEQRRIMVLDDVSPATRLAVIEAEQAAVAAVTTAVREARDEKALLAAVATAVREAKAEQGPPHECGWWSWRAALLGGVVFLGLRWLAS